MGNERVWMQVRFVPYSFQRFNEETLNMAHSVEMPELGESVTEGTITTWLKEVGDTVEVDEPLLEVSTDKVDTCLLYTSDAADDTASV